MILPYEQFQLIHGECLAEMSNIPDANVDMVLCDLPYGTTQNKWDTVIDLPELWSAYRRVCRPNAAIVLTAAQPFTSALVMSNVREFKYQWVWEKSSATGHLNAKRMPMKLHEDVVVFGNAPYYPQGLLPLNKVVRRGNNGTNFGDSGKENFQEWTNYPRSILRFPHEGKKVHPTQKPVALMEYLIKTYTHEGMTVLDNCMGSGTTGVACANLNRRFIGIEQDGTYFKIAQDRITAAFEQRANVNAA